jgi:hypothetical protein
VTSLGLKSLVFAPLSFLNSAPSKKVLQFMLVTQFADEGKSLRVVKDKTTEPSYGKELEHFLDYPFGELAVKKVTKKYGSSTGHTGSRAWERTEG